MSSDSVTERIRELNEFRHEYSYDTANEMVRGWLEDAEYMRQSLTRCRNECRMKHNITWRQFARLCGITTGQLSLWTGEPIETNPDFVD